MNPVVPIEQLDSDLLRDADSTAQLPVAEAQDVIQKAAAAAPAPLPTMKLSALLPPPPSKPLRTTPMAALAPAPAPSSSHGAPSPVPARRPSWIRDLIGAALAPTEAHAHDHAVNRRAAGAACIGLAMAFALAALVTGLRGAPDASVAPVVGAALLLSRSIVALGAGAFSFGLLRMAERLLTTAPEDRSDPER